MKELYEEGVTTHLGPESCAGDGNITGEALTGVHAGLAIELRNHPLSVPTQWTVREGNIPCGVSVSRMGTLRSRGN